MINGAISSLALVIIDNIGCHEKRWGKAVQLFKGKAVHYLMYGALWMVHFDVSVVQRLANGCSTTGIREFMASSFRVLSLPLVLSFIFMDH